MKKSVSMLFMFFGILFVSCLCFSNVAASKMIMIGPWAITAGVLIFPITYILSDVITEVYGFKKARSIMWLGFGMNLLMVGYFQLAIILKAPVWFTNSEAFKTVLGSTPRLFAASLIAYVAGSFLNSMVLSKMKVHSNGKRFGVRAVVSTLIGEGVDATIFITLAFIGTMPLNTLLGMIVVQLIMKVAYETVALPLTGFVVKKVKLYEGIDVYDRSIKYSLIK